MLDWECSLGGRGSCREVGQSGVIEDSLLRVTENGTSILLHSARTTRQRKQCPTNRMKQNMMHDCTG